MELGLAQRGIGLRVDMDQGEAVIVPKGTLWRGKVSQGGYPG